MMAFGSILAMVSLLHYRAVNGAIARGDAGGNDRLIIGVSTHVEWLGAAMIFYMLSTR